MLKKHYAELLGLDLENNKNSEWLDLSINELSKYDDVWLKGDFMRIDNIKDYNNITLNGIDLLVK